MKPNEECEVLLCLGAMW